jgi:hypothetical protein
VRVYIPLTVPGLTALHATSRIAPAPFAAHAVTPAMRSAVGEADDEELEYSALMAAAYDSLVLIAQTGAEARRVVVAADVDDSDVTVVGGDDVSLVDVAAEVPLGRCSAVHVDDADADGEVALAVARLPEAQAGDGHALAAVSLVELELMWFATQEIPDLLA